VGQREILFYMKKHRGVEFSIKDIVEVFGTCENSASRCLKKLCLSGFIVRGVLKDKSVRYRYV